jgi:hypothetical protein
MLKIGSAGTFDDSGITLGSIVHAGSECYAFYTGWKRRRYGIPFELSIGLARVLDDGDRLEKVFTGPLIAQDRNHPFLVAGPYVVQDETRRFKMWYCSGEEWRFPAHGAEPIYTVYFSQSSDGLNWEKNAGGPCIQYKFEGEVISAPWVVRLQSGYLMFYPYRGSSDRNSKNYNIGVAVSVDGLKWDRKDECAGIERSTTGWDSEMICYPAVVTLMNRTYMFYSGNAVGRGGFGYAVANEKLDLLDC